MSEQRICPPHHKHELTSNCATYHRCQCEPCRSAECERQRFYRYYKGADVLVSSLGVMRRLQALTAIGWTSGQIAEQLGCTQDRVNRARIGDKTRIQASFHLEVERFYQKHQMTFRDGPYSKRARNLAMKRGWVPPLAWDNIDDPNEQPAGTRIPRVKEMRLAA